MAAQLPCSGRNFVVDLGDGAGDSGFAQVVFPEFRTDGKQDAPMPPLLLRRAVTGAGTLNEWWTQACAKPQDTARTVRVTLIAADHEQIVRSWRFIGALPVSISYSPLDANAAELVYETLALGFERIEIG